MYLITVDSKGKCRIAEVTLTSDTEGKSYTISRITGLKGGKKISHPSKVITAGKAKRTIQEQAELEFNHIISEYKDKGYKEVDTDPETLSDTDITNIIGSVKSDQNGFKKHMLAKQVKDVNPSSVEAVKEWYVSRKIDGLRNSFYLKDNEIISASRGGKDYNNATTHLRTNPTLIQFFQNHPNVILDGELYVHGKSLQQLSGCARTEIGQTGFKLQYYVYDVVEDKPFTERLVDLQTFAEELNCTEFQPDREFNDGELMIQFVPHVLVTGSDKMKQIWKLHDQYVSEGWEGCVARDATKTYKYGGRSIDMIKFKNYRDDCFKVVGKEAGLRGSEDMVFICALPDGRTFKAKPFGTRAEKQEYWDNFDSKYKNHIGECKFFYESEDGIPLQPSFKSFRWDIE